MVAVRLAAEKQIVGHAVQKEFCDARRKRGRGMCILNETIPGGASGPCIRSKPRGGINVIIVRRTYWIRNGGFNWPLRESKVQQEEPPPDVAGGSIYLDLIPIRDRLHHLVGLLARSGPCCPGSTGSGPLDDHQQIRLPVKKSEI